MTQSQVREPKSFGRRNEPHTIVITKNGRSRHYTLNPLYFTVLVGFVAMFSVGYFSATAYLVLRDDLISARGARNARVLQEYEDRISALRTNLDRVTSRQLLDQQAVEAKVAELIRQQKLLGGRDPAMQSILDKARAFGLEQTAPQIDQTITGSIKPEKQAAILPPFDSGFILRGVGESQNLALAGVSNKEPVARIATVRDEFSYQAGRSLFAELEQSLSEIDADQKQIVSSLHDSANEKITKITKLMKRVGVNISRKYPGEVTAAANSQMGGPFVPLGRSADFSALVDALDYSLLFLDAARKKADTLPLAAPTASNSYSSKFGPRVDPFKRTYALHTGLDIRGKRGAAIKATGRGKVTYAGWKGGLGIFVEIDHGNGMKTRFAHMSKVLVKKGQIVDVGTLVGKVGSTGRSTGPHLHYEVRRNGVAIDPEKYINIGKKLAKLM